MAFSSVKDNDFTDEPLPRTSINAATDADATARPEDVAGDGLGGFNWFGELYLAHPQTKQQNDARITRFRKNYARSVTLELQTLC